MEATVSRQLKVYRYSCTAWSTVVYIYWRSTVDCLAIYSQQKASVAVDICRSRKPHTKSWTQYRPGEGDRHRPDRTLSWTVGHVLSLFGKRSWVRIPRPTNLYTSYQIKHERSYGPICCGWELRIMIQTLLLILSRQIFFHYFMHMRVKTICRF